MLDEEKYERKTKEIKQKIIEKEMTKFFHFSLVLLYT